jgi:hypothetical protein
MRAGSAEDHGGVAAGEQAADAIGQGPRAGRDVVELGVEVVEESADRLGVVAARQADIRSLSRGNCYSRAYSSAAFDSNSKPTKRSSPSTHAS